MLLILQLFCNNPEHKALYRNNFNLFAEKELTNVLKYILSLAVTFSDENNKEKEDNGILKCTICNTEPISVVFFPCMHVISCFKCAQNSQICHRCEREIKMIKKVYFSKTPS